MPRFASLALLALLLVTTTGCRTTRPKPTGAGSTQALRLLRDWRGVWSGAAQDSPMGPMPYVLLVQEDGDKVTATLRRQREADLEDVSHVWELVSFRSGTPRIRFTLTQRGGTQRGEVTYNDELSDEDRAVFCSTDRGCDKVKLTIERVSDTELTWRTLVDEAAHATFGLRFTSAQLPPAQEEAEPEKTRAEPARKPGKGQPLDKDLRLKEHLDPDIPEPPPKAPRPKKPVK